MITRYYRVRAEHWHSRTYSTYSSAREMAAALQWPPYREDFPIDPNTGWPLPTRGWTVVETQEGKPLCGWANGELWHTPGWADYAR